MRKEEILHIFPDFMRPVWEKTAQKAGRVQEIRLRVDRPVTILMDNEEWFLTKDGELSKEMLKALISSEKELEAVLEHVCHYSVYAFADEIRQGYITVPGGHRIGLCGQVIPENDGRIRNIKYIRYLNIRIAHEIKGVSDKLLPFLYKDGEILNTLIISPPGCGKTTMLRDLARNCSEGNIYGQGRNVAVVDERSEIAGSFLGIPQNDVGARTDVMDNCPKHEGMMMLIRSMAPSVIAVDELGSAKDVEAMQQAMQCGCRMLATIHGYSLEEVGGKEYMKNVLKEKLFGRYILLGKINNTCNVMGIYDNEGKLC